VTEFLVKCLTIPQENIIIRASSEYPDLLDAIDTGYDSINIEKDSKPLQYYKNKYGMAEIVGRNFNFSLRHKNTQIFNDIGNVIVIEDNKKKYGVEVALGAITIMSDNEWAISYGSYIRDIYCVTYNKGEWRIIHKTKRLYYV
jgi:hypothetical protein